MLKRAAAAALLPLLFLCLPGAASAQWATSGTNINNTNPGNVGVGTPNPRYRLEITTPGSNTQLRFGSDTADSGGYLVSTHASQAIMVGGASWTGSSWLAKSSAASIVNADSGTLMFFTNGGLTSGTTFAPAERVRISPAGNVGVGTTAPLAKLHVVGDIRVDGNINAKYQDVAEWVPSTQKLTAGVVVILDAGRNNHVTASSSPYDTSVAGVISAQPGIALGEAGEGKVLVATTGRVKVKVDATRLPVRAGDLLVTSEREGYAMRSEPVMFGTRKMHSPGTIVGKALEPLEKGTGEILVLLSLQ